MSEPFDWDRIDELVQQIEADSPPPDTLIVVKGTPLYGYLLKEFGKRVRSQMSRRAWRRLRGKARRKGGSHDLRTQEQGET